MKSCVAAGHGKTNAKAARKESGKRGNGGGMRLWLLERRVRRPWRGGLNMGGRSRFLRQRYRVAMKMRLKGRRVFAIRICLCEARGL